MADRHGALICTAINVDISVRAREQLEEIIVGGIPPPPSANIVWGGTWFCPFDGRLMVEMYGAVHCSCGRALPGRLMYELTEFSPHPESRSASPRPIDQSEVAAWIDPATLRQSPTRRLRFRSFVPSPWGIVDKESSLQIRGCEVQGVFTVPRESVAYFTLLDAVIVPRFVDFENGLGRVPNTLLLNARWGRRNNVELVFRSPQPPVLLKNADIHAARTRPFEPVDSICFSASPRKTTAFFTAIGIPLRIDTDAALQETIGKVPEPEPPTADEVAKYFAEVEASHAKSRRTRTWLRVTCAPIIASWTYLLVTAPTHGNPAKGIALFATVAASTIVFPPVIHGAFTGQRDHRARRTADRLLSK
jgi:hypothetical protein